MIVLLEASAPTLYYNRFVLLNYYKNKKSELNHSSLTLDGGKAFEKT